MFSKIKNVLLFDTRLKKINCKEKLRRKSEKKKRYVNKCS